MFHRPRALFGVGSHTKSSQALNTGSASSCCSPRLKQSWSSITSDLLQPWSPLYRDFAATCQVRRSARLAICSSGLPLMKHSPYCCRSSLAWWGDARLGKAPARHLDVCRIVGVSSLVFYRSSSQRQPGRAVRLVGGARWPAITEGSCRCSISREGRPISIWLASGNVEEP